jgi:hypothetical protein
MSINWQGLVVRATVSEIINDDCFDFCGLSCRDFDIGSAAPEEKKLEILIRHAARNGYIMCGVFTGNICRLAFYNKRMMEDLCQ